MKWYPCCTCNAPAIDGILALKVENNLSPENIQAIEVRVRKTCFSLVGEPLEKKQNPRNILEAQMSAPYCVAAALIDGELFPKQFSENAMGAPRIQALTRKVSVVWDPLLDVSGTPRPVPAEVIILLKDGRKLGKRVDYQKGSYRHPLTLEEGKRKFSICVERRLSEKGRDKFIEIIQNLEEIDDLNQVEFHDLCPGVPGETEDGKLE